MRWQLILATALCWAAGRLSSTAAEDPATWQSRGLIARWHFAGMQQIITDPNAAHVKEVAGLPETGAMRDYVLDKLAAAPYNFLKGDTAITNDEAQFIRPLLEDLIKAESLVEVGATTNRVPEFALALRLKDERAGMWNSVVGRVISAWTGLRQTAIKEGGFTGWEIKKHENPNTIRFFRAGDWVVFGWGQDDARLVTGMLDRIAKTTRPVDTLSDAWLDAWVDWPALAARHQSPVSWDLPAMRLIMQGKKDYVRSLLTLKFSAPLGLAVNSWRIPTNVIRGPVVSFTAARGVLPLLDNRPLVRRYRLPPLPDQFFVWEMTEQSGIPLKIRYAAPVNDASNYLRQLAPGLVQLLNSVFKAHPSPLIGPGPGHQVMFQAVWTNGQVSITGTPFITPYLAAVHRPGGDTLAGSLLPGMDKPIALPAQLLKEVEAKNNMVYYSWELTGEHLKQWPAVLSLWRIFTTAEEASGQAPPDRWILALEPKLGNCGTEVSLTAPNELTVLRNSTIGFNAFELAILAYWMDSPNFPLNAFGEPMHWKPASNPPNGR